MITFISGPRGKSFMAGVLASQSYSPLFNPYIGPTAFIFHDGASEEEITDKAATYQDVIICCPDGFPDKVGFPARFMKLPESLVSGKLPDKGHSDVCAIV